jgi:ATP-dependent 26S proteasome regulatory subunit
MEELLTRIPQLVAARYPLIYLVSSEEERVERGLKSLMTSAELPLYRWRATTGLLDPGETLVEGSQFPFAMLEKLDRIEGKALFLLEDFSVFLEDGRVIRKIRDLLRLLETRKQAILFLSQGLTIPPMLEKDLVILDIPLPGRAEIGKLLALLLKSQRIEVAAELFEQFVTASLGLSEKEIKRAYARVLVDGSRFTAKDLDLLIDEKEKLIRKSRFLEYVRSDLGVRELGGMENLKDWLKQRTLAFTEKAREFGLPEPKGLFLLGVQGCGKSLSAKVVANMWKVPLIRLDIAALFAGRAEEGLRETIRVAESLAPAILWIDEIEKAFFGDAGGGRVFGSFLTWMQEKTQPVFVVATANEVKSLPPELLRKGRFDEIFFVDLPNVHERLEILEIHLKRRGRSPDAFDLLAIAEETDRYSGAELEQLINAALFRAFAAGRGLSQEDLLKTARETVPLAITMDDRLKELRDWARPRARPASLDTRRISFFEDWDQE